MKNSTLTGGLDTARSLLAAGKLDEAEHATRSLIATNAADHRAWHLLSLVAAKRGRLIEALTCIGHAVAIEPKDAGLRLQQGQYLIANGQRREALDVAMSLAGATHSRADWNENAQKYCQTSGKCLDKRLAPANVGHRRRVYHEHTRIDANVSKICSGSRNDSSQTAQYIELLVLFGPPKATAGMQGIPQMH